jgi:hypothetical protein
MLSMPVATTEHRSLSFRWTLVAAAAVALLGSLACPGGIGRAYAADDEPDDTADTKFVRGILSGLGLKREGDDAGIDYHERSPLVVPPTRDLPPPAAGAAITRDPAWPKDPDIKRVKTVKRKQLTTVAAEQEEMRQLRPDELNAQRARAGQTGAAATGTQPVGARPEQMTPGQLGHTGFKWSSWTSFFDREGTVVPFVQEPPRASLTDPPTGLRTPSPKYQYGSKGTLEPTREIGTDAAVGVR